MAKVIEEMKFGPVQLDVSATPPGVPHPNRLPFNGVLCILDVPSDRAVRGAGGKRVILPCVTANRALSSLLGMAVDCAVGMRGHDERRKIGVVTRAQIVSGRFEVSGHLFYLDFPEEVKKIHEKGHQPGGVGMSFKATDVRVANPCGEILVLTALTFTGATILETDAAAWQGTSIAAAADPLAPTAILTNMEVPDHEDQGPEMVITAADWLGPEMMRRYAERVRASFEFRARNLSCAARTALETKINDQVSSLEELAFEMQKWQMANPEKVGWHE